MSIPNASPTSLTGAGASSNQGSQRNLNTNSQTPPHQTTAEKTRQEAQDRFKQQQMLRKEQAIADAQAKRCQAEAQMQAKAQAVHSEAQTRAKADGRPVTHHAQELYKESKIIDTAQTIADAKNKQRQTLNQAQAYAQGVHSEAQARANADGRSVEYHTRAVAKERKIIQTEQAIADAQAKRHQTEAKMQAKAEEIKAQNQAYAQAASVQTLEGIAQENQANLKNAGQKINNIAREVQLAKENNQAEIERQNQQQQAALHAEQMKREEIERQHQIKMEELQRQAKAREQGRPSLSKEEQVALLDQVEELEQETDLLESHVGTLIKNHQASKKREDDEGSSSKSINSETVLPPPVHVNTQTEETPSEGAKLAVGVVVVGSLIYPVTRRLYYVGISAISLFTCQYNLLKAGLERLQNSKLNYKAQCLTILGSIATSAYSYQLLTRVVAASSFSFLALSLATAGLCNLTAQAIATH